MRRLLDGVHVLRMPESKSQRNTRIGAILNLGTPIARVLTAVDGRNGEFRGFFGRRTEQGLDLVEALVAEGAFGLGQRAEDIDRPAARARIQSS